MKSLKRQSTLMCMFSYGEEEAATRGVLKEKVFLEISQNSQQQTCARAWTPPGDCFWKMCK